MNKNMQLALEMYRWNLLRPCAELHLVQKCSPCPKLNQCGWIDTIARSCKVDLVEFKSHLASVDAFEDI